ncbi:ATP-binding cassette domain-containing protein [Sediminibacterium ginsengisoli]|uniref:Molybdate transport system ATP-binding protein n=1 Tax=Sediminibacterium ginsengisoli TaxID=413434 RepID=A0A1T4RHE4_9BACT|nr:ATP-binding cassette domain-containing protein [Sediminibacterium ginsengisoli]SKA15081.1 molybdate transport system ATP-binding protein [Sediminibacterium ginsengisoli]
MKQLLLEVSDLTVKAGGQLLLEHVSFAVHAGQQLAVAGASGSGKTSLLKCLAAYQSTGDQIRFHSITGKKPSVAVIGQQLRFKNLANTSTFYYQQRYNSTESSDAKDVYTVLSETSRNESEINEVLALLRISHVKHTSLLQLSNGENKKVQLAKALLERPDWLLLDNPYTGLDAAARTSLDEILTQLAAAGFQLLIVTSPALIPQVATHVALLENGTMSVPEEKEKFLAQRSVKPVPRLEVKNEPPQLYEYPDFETAVKMKGISVSYNGKAILDDINWEVKKGECWNISGHNGSGKSTLLSLVNADNPQAFANNIYLFDRKKGSGESIWDIKRKIGYVSPELHHHFEANATAEEVVASGLFDTIGLFRTVSAEQKKAVNYWMTLMETDALAKKRLAQLSHGQQRLVLLARAMVKNPPLLILDEPCQGLDHEKVVQFVQLVDDICVKLQKTLIYVSHYKEEIPACVTKELRLWQGKIAV